MDDPEEAEPPPANVQDLPPELIGKSAKYLDVRDGDLRNLVTVVAGRRNDSEKRIIKRVYLERNVEYLLYVSDEATRGVRALRNRLGEMCRHWMEINDDWRNSIKPYHGIDMPGRFADVELKAITEGDLAESVRWSPSGHVTIPVSTYFSDDKAVFRPDDVFVGINGRDVSGLDPDDVTRLLMEGGSTPTKVRLMASRVANIFLNPALAIDLGLSEVLRYLVEDVEIDVNLRCCQGVLFKRRMPLITHALIHPDPFAFRYLLSVHNIDVTCLLWESSPQDDFATTLLHALKDERVKDAIEDFPLDATRIETLLNSDEGDVDVFDIFGRTPLKRLVEWGAVSLDKPVYLPYDKSDLLLAKAFLDAGASARNVRLSFLSNGEGYDAKMLALLEAKDREERDEIIASLDR